MMVKEIFDWWMTRQPPRTRNIRFPSTRVMIHFATANANHQDYAIVKYFSDVPIKDDTGLEMRLAEYLKSVGFEKDNSGFWSKQS